VFDFEMECLYETKSNGKKEQCFSVTEYVSIWITTDRFGYSQVTLGHHTMRDEYSMRVAKEEGLVWGTDLRELLDVIAENGPLDQLVAEAKERKTSSHRIDCGEDKTVHVFHSQFPPKVQFDMGQRYIRVPLRVFVVVAEQLIQMFA
jgi:hypothetical protein